MKRVFALLFFLFITAPAFADLTYVQKIHSGPIMGQPAKDMTLTTYIKGKKERSDAGPGQWILVDLDQSKMYMVDDTKKSVFVGTLDQMKQMMGKMMASQNVKATVQKTGKSETVNGIECQEYSLSTTGQGMMLVNGTFCMTESVSADYEPFKEFGQDWMRMLGADELAKLKGVPVKSATKISIMGQSMDSTTEVVSISHDTVPASKFVIPADYKVQEMPKMPQQEHP